MPNQSLKKARLWRVLTAIGGTPFASYLSSRSRIDGRALLFFGHYEELPDLPKYEAARAKALELLQKHAMWWEPAGIGATHRDATHSEIPITYRIRIDRMTGHRATPNAESAVTAQEPKEKDGWWV